VVITEFAAPIPEPASLALLAIRLLALPALRRPPAEDLSLKENIRPVSQRES
jgi:hypothetical protein